jgi:hypothetical protein
VVTNSPGIRPLILDGFVLSNFAFLTLDIWLAHSVNEFAHPAEWVPLVFSILAAVAVGVAMLKRASAAGRWIGLATGWASIAVGVAGTYLHLESQFFAAYTLEALVYTAPFVAPLAYAGLGFLLVLNRMLDAATDEWGAWIVFMGLGGFVGNFVLSVCDHAQNGFFHLTEWIPVVTSAVAIGFLIVALWDRDPRFRRLTYGVLVAQVGVGVLGFAMHFLADLGGVSKSAYQNFIHGAPIFAPLLFANLAILAGFGVWATSPPELAGAPAAP